MTDPATNLSGRVCMVTGATAGIGLVTARELARSGATVIMVGRSRERGRDAVETIQRDTGNKLVSFIAVDLSSQASVRAFAQAFLGSHSRLHVLVNNAGGFFAIRQESIDGIEMTLALNHVSPFPLTTLLLDALKAGAAAKVWALSESLLAARSAK